jgi:lipopolysaccharide export system protein LptA
MERLQASGSVEVFLHQQHAQADAMDYDPTTVTAYLSGKPRLSQGLYQVTGHKMQLNKLASLVEGVPDQRVEVILPPLQASPLPAADLTDTETNTNQSTDTPPTVITSLNLKYTQDASKTVFEFTDAVRITGHQLQAQCGKLIVYAYERHKQAQLRIDRMEANGDVRMVYQGRTGQSDTAEIDLTQDRVILQGNAQFEDVSGIVSGHKITYSQGVGVQVESDPTRKQRNTIQLQDTVLPLP